jgi:hypothetical protein
MPDTPRHEKAELPQQRPGDEPGNPQRRRLLKGGAAAAPVLMTVVSRSALGQGGICATPSAFTSINSSRPSQRIASCSGRWPEFWQRNPDEWPAGFETTTRYHSPTTGLGGTFFGDSTLMQVFEGSGGGQVMLGRHILAGLFNARAGLTPLIPEFTVRNMWNEFVARGYFEPTAGVRWYPDEIILYIRSTMI